MKKILKFSILFFIVLLFFLNHYGFEIGNIHIGKKMDFTTIQNKDFEKSKFNIEHYSKSKLIVLNVWATWCEPCVEEIPELNAIKKQFDDKSIDFLSLSIDTDSIKLLKFNDSHKFKFKDITFENLKYKNSILNTLENRKKDVFVASNAVPITYLIKDQKVIKKFEGQIEKDELTKLLSEIK